MSRQLHPDKSEKACGNRSRYLLAVAAIGLLAATTPARSGLIEAGAGLDNVADRSMQFDCGGANGTLSINEYFSWTSGVDAGTGIPYAPQNPGLPVTGAKWEDRGGAAIEATVTSNSPHCKNLRWVQGIISGTGTIGPAPYLDPFNRDDGLPFYWTEPENADPAVGNNGKRFSDIPGQAKTNAGNSIHFEAALVAVDMANMEVQYLKGFTWGYEILAQAVIDLDTFAWTAAPSAGLINLVTAWDASAVAPFAGDGTPDGWKWSNHVIPEPGTPWLVFAAALFGLAWRPRAARPALAKVRA